jgi:NAD-dependent deacetylase
MGEDPLLPAGLREAVRGLSSLGVITGAGISAESGIPTYRGRGGLYDDPAEGDRTIEALSGSTLLYDPDRTWRTIADLARRSLGALPNPAHHALVRLEAGLERFVLLTQNVDGLHEAAGSRNVIDLHGNVRRTLCQVCGAKGRIEREEAARLERAPACPACGGVLRPDVVLFEETLPEDKVARFVQEFYATPPDALLVVGTSAAFSYIVEPIAWAAAQGRLTIEVNPEASDLSSFFSFSVRARAGEAVPRLAEWILGGGGGSP